ncbi:sensor histidine kinase [Streptomyces daliensis]|uniref:histidine kinase n=1 Tax=Streptomyces daliensis TaxID=299421 RepID=A0A8T4J2Y7_9ACTN|nr:CHASE3 domain-containing protein [Streptomyces daliensis]
MNPTDPAAYEGRRVRRLSAQSWIHLVLAVNTLLLVVFAAVGGTLQARTDERVADLSERLHPARTAFFQMETALVDQETGVRGYVLSRDPSFLEPYTEGRREERRLYGELRRLIGDDARLGGDLRAIRSAVADWRREYARPLIASAGDPAERVAVLEASKGKFDEARRQFASLEKHINAARAQARADAAGTRSLRNWAFVAMLAGFLASAVVLALLLHRIVGRPLRALESASARVGAGAFGETIRIEGPRDLESVARVVEEMRGRIVTELSASRDREALLTRQAGELDAQTAELRRSNAELEQFAYVASHDLQEPLRKVASFCQLLEKRYSGRLDDRGRQYIAFAVDGAKRMQGLINDLLTFSRIGRYGSEPRPVLLDEVLDRALANLALSIEETGAVVERPEALPTVEGDPTALTMLWQNLIGNAVKFRHPDRPPRITVTCEAEGDVWSVLVADNGIGVPPEFSEKVFVIFQRLHSREEYEGTGIGLALCRKIVEHHGGHIGVETAPEGARVRFTLPVVGAASGTTTSGTTTATVTEEPDTAQGALP